MNFHRHQRELVRPCWRARTTRGVAALGVLVCLVIVSALAATLVQDVWSRVEESQRQRQLVQADWLVASGVDRAIQRLSHDPNYQGEIWQISPEELSARYRGEVQINVTESSQKAKGVVVEARLLLGDKVVVKLTRRIATG